ncbi:MAG: hypothetical protein IJ418_12210 [Clostridia bacterium]|nr:hypothetical protein [Clostridia bacterium]
MKQWIALALLFALLFVTPAMAQEDAGVIVQSSCSIVPSGEYYMVYCFAQVHNNTDQVLTLDEGVFSLQSGEEVIAAEEVSKLWPHFVAPGEDGYLFDIVPFEQLPQITGLDYDVQYLTINPAYAGVQLETATSLELDDSTHELHVICEIDNGASVDAYNPTVVMGLYTDAGQLVYADGRSLQDVGIAQGGKLLVRFSVEPMLVEQWMSYGALPTQVRAGTMFRTGSD